MNARVSDVAFEHLRIADGVVQKGVVGGFGLFQFGNAGNGVRQVHLGHLPVWAFGQFVGDGFAEAVAGV